MKFNSLCVSLGSSLTVLYFFIFCILTCVASLDESSKAEVEEIFDKKLRNSTEIDRAVKKQLESDEGRELIKEGLLSDKVQQEMKKQLILDSDMVRAQVSAYLKTMDYKQALKENTGYSFETILAIMATALILPSVLINIMLFLCFKCVKCVCINDKPPKQPAHREAVVNVPNTNTQAPSMSTTTTRI